MEAYHIAFCTVACLALAMIAVAIVRKKGKKQPSDSKESNEPPILAIIGDSNTIRPYLKEKLDKQFILIENKEGEQGLQNSRKQLKENPDTRNIPIILLSNITDDDDDNTMAGEVMYAEDELLDKIRKAVQENLHDPDFTVKQLAEHLNMSMATLYRRIKEVSDISLTDQIRTLRMKRAGKLLAQGKHSVQEVSELVGYNDLATFRKHFANFYHTTPSAFKNEKKG